MILAALLFGTGTPFAKMLTGQIAALPLSGFLYLGSGIVLGIWLLIRRFFETTASDEAPLSRPDIPWLAIATIFGGILAPFFLLTGLRLTSSSTSALLLNLENVFTLLLAWSVFHENFDRRILVGVIAIIAGGLILSWAGIPEGFSNIGPIFIAAACLCWAIDNNLTRKISSGDPVQIAAIKGLMAGIILLLAGVIFKSDFGNVKIASYALLLGFVSYGLSLVFFIQGLRHLGTARTAAYFSMAPFVGAAVSFIILHERLTLIFVAASILMIIGIYLHLSDRHKHGHRHEEFTHDHKHIHDEHHEHRHENELSSDEPHRHIHTHEILIHSHPHYPDIHHRHRHD